METIWNKNIIFVKLFWLGRYGVYKSKIFT